MPLIKLLTAPSNGHSAVLIALRNEHSGRDNVQHNDAL